MTNRHATGQTGEALVGAELARAGFTIAFPTGNAKDIDILAYKNGESRAVQVKTISKGSLQLNLGKFLNIEFSGEPGNERQIIHGPLNGIDSSIDLVVVFLGTRLGEDEFYCTKLGQFSEFAAKSHGDYLKDGKRPGNNKKSLHAGHKREVIAASCVFRNFNEHFS